MSGRVPGEPMIRYAIFHFLVNALVICWFFGGMFGGFYLIEKGHYIIGPSLIVVMLASLITAGVGHIEDKWGR